MKMEYPKIETLFNRDEKFKVVEGDFSLPEFDNIKRWRVTEKIDGTNVRIKYRPSNKYETRKKMVVRFAGKTDRAQLHPNLLKHLESTFTLEKLLDIFPATGELDEDGHEKLPRVTLFGEGYGPKIQRGGNYRKDISIRLFDVFVHDFGATPYNGWWLEPENVEDIAHKLDVETVPHLFNASLETAVDFVKSMKKSYVAELDGGNSQYLMEGVVARTQPLLFTRKGERVIWKLKTKDFHKEALR